MVVGTDTYLTLADANIYLNANYATTDPLLVAWTALTDPDREAYLRKARQTIDRQPIVGYKAIYTQALAFPRTIYTEYGALLGQTINLMHVNNWHTQTTVPTEVLDAQCEIALQLASGTPKRVELQRQGVRSFSIGKLSETYVGAGNRIVSDEAKELLAPFLARAVRTC